MAKQQDTSAEEYVLPFEKPIARLAREIRELAEGQTAGGRDYSAEIRQLRNQHVSLLKKTYSALTAWETVQVSRHPRRPLANDYINAIVKDFMEIRGDRLFGDDRSTRCGFGRIGGDRVMMIAQHKGRDTK